VKKVFRVMLLGGLGTLGLSSQWAGAQTVSNVRAQQLQDGTKRVQILFDLSNVATPATVTVSISSDGGATWPIIPAASTLSGNVGSGQVNGTNKQIIWNAAASLPSTTYGTNYRAAVAAVSAATGDVAFTLQWTGCGDLDLHVKEPSGEEIYFGHPTSATGGRLDHDIIPCSSPCPASNVENVYWATGTAPRGTYQVWTRYFSPCGGSTNINFTLQIKRGTTVIQSYTGTLSPSTNSSTYTTTY
jgi:hypothetical protein